VTLLAALIVTIAGLSLATSLLMSGGSGTFRLAVAELGLEARAYADACAENGLYEIQNGILFSGEGELTFSNGSCSYQVDSINESASSVEATGFAESAIRKVRVDVETEITSTEMGTSTVITDYNWQEVADL
jgi:hypothetical protein